jgi:CBS domain-containing protein
MNVGEVMTKRVSWVGPDATVREIARRMRSEDIGSMPVAEDDKLVGMVTDRDIVVRGVAEEREINRLTAREVMSSTSGAVLYCFEDESVEAVLKNMAENQVRRLPVVDRSKRLVGIVSLGDLSGAAERATGDALREIADQPDSTPGRNPAS